jgi:acetyl-CoA carboxylase biotin carboxyl carrier protein
MDFKQIQELIKLVNESNIGEVTIEQKDFKITVRQKEAALPALAAPMPQMPVFGPMLQQAMQQSALPAAQAPNTSSEIAAAAPAAANTVTIKSPMIGTFYRRSSPEKPNFIEVGDEVAPGKVVCIIEAMKLFNEIESEVSGKVVKILVEDASPVEYDQPLFVVEPS